MKLSQNLIPRNEFSTFLKFVGILIQKSHKFDKDSHQLTFAWKLKFLFTKFKLFNIIFYLLMWLMTIILCMRTIFLKGIGGKSVIKECKIFKWTFNFSVSGEDVKTHVTEKMKWWKVEENVFWEFSFLCSTYLHSCSSSLASIHSHLHLHLSTQTRSAKMLEWLTFKFILFMNSFRK
jgi:hypothetical protein